MQPFLVLTVIVNTIWIDAFPPGVIIAFAGSSLPIGWTECDGSLRSLGVHFL
jgi:hypothetical protein